MTSRLIIDLRALAANYRLLAAAAAPAECGAVVKADGYGIGSLAVVDALLSAGCGSFFVATVAEAQALRREFSDPTIYVFAGADAVSAQAIVDARAIPVLNHEAELAPWRHRSHPVALHIDTGMNRLGFDHATIDAIDTSGLDVVLLVSHLACADEPEHPRNALQYERFERVRERFPGLSGSMLNSAAILTHASVAGDLCRPGVALYGGNPFVDRVNPMACVVRLEAKVLQLKDVAHDDTVGYGASYRARGKRLLAVVGAGYADGVPRLLSNLGVAAVHGARVPYAGRVSMDLVALDVSEVAGQIAIGDWVELIGEVVPIDEVAALARTISYEVLTGLGRRSERIYRGAS